MSYAVTTPPASEPISLAEAKAHLRVTTDDEDAYITALLAVARNYVENILWRSLVTQTITLTLRRFPPGRRGVVLPAGPVQSITSIAYVDTANANQTLTVGDQLADLVADPPTIEPALATAWPATTHKPAAVTIVYVAGYGDDSTDVPDDIRHALKLLIGEYYEYRENTARAAVVRAVDSLLAPHKLRDDRILEFLE